MFLFLERILSLVIVLDYRKSAFVHKEVKG